MPWKGCSVMDERLQFVAELCREFGISRKLVAEQPELDLFFLLGRRFTVFQSRNEPEGRRKAADRWGVLSEGFRAKCSKGRVSGWI